MLSVGLTGGIGAGKSAVAAALHSLGAVVLDADRFAREVVEPGTDGLAEVIAEFGRGVLASDGSLDRHQLGAIAFADDAARSRLNAIVHPRVRARAAALVAAAPEDSVIVHDIPLLVETGQAALHHLVVVVDAPAAERIGRLVRTRGMTEADARARMAAQATDEKRRAAADVLLVNDGSLDELVGQVNELWYRRLVPFEENLRLVRPAALPAQPALRPTDPRWAAAAARLSARLALIGGDRAVHIDHVGPTAVAGIAADGVLELQLTVPAGDAVEWPATVGFPTMTPVLPADRELAECPAFATADPGCPAILTVREVDDPYWWRSLAVRDWLRSDAAARATFEADERRLAARYADSWLAYQAAVRAWGAVSRAGLDGWIAARGWRPAD
jgi:dephospho-CoA kinase